MSATVRPRSPPSRCCLLGNCHSTDSGQLSRQSSASHVYWNGEATDATPNTHKDTSGEIKLGHSAVQYHAHIRENVTLLFLKLVIETTDCVDVYIYCLADVSCSVPNDKICIYVYFMYVYYRDYGRKTNEEEQRGAGNFSLNVDITKIHLNAQLLHDYAIN